MSTSLVTPIRRSISLSRSSEPSHGGQSNDSYTSAADPDRTVLSDLSSKCGVGGGAVQDITVNYDLDLHLKILGISIQPKLSSSASFPCPISASDISVSAP